MKVMSTTTRYFIKPLTISILIAIAVLIGNSNTFADGAKYVGEYSGGNIMDRAPIPMPMDPNT